MSTDRHGPLGHFDAPVEAAYQRWYIERFRPLGVAMAAASIAAWIVNPLIVLLFLNPEHVVAMFIVCWGVNIPSSLPASCTCDDQSRDWRSNSLPLCSS